MKYWKNIIVLRWIARLIDTAFLAGIAYGSNVVALLDIIPDDKIEKIVFYSFFTMLYYGFIQYKTGQSIGKKYVGIKVITKSSLLLPFKTSIARAFFCDGVYALLFSLMLVYSGLETLISLGVMLPYLFLEIIMLFNSGNSSLHDYLLKTEVVRESGI